MGLAKELTKKMLEEDYKIKIEIDAAAEYGYRIYHYGQDPGKATFSWKEIHPKPNVTPHPKGNDKTYLMVNWSDYRQNKTQKSVPLQRLVWCYFVEDIPAGYDIHHKDDNTYNNYICLEDIEKSNLAMITHAENVRLRKKAANQYTGGKKDGQNN